MYPLINIFRETKLSSIWFLVVQRPLFPSKLYNLHPNHKYRRAYTFHHCSFQNILVFVYVSYTTVVHRYQRPVLSCDYYKCDYYKCSAVFYHATIGPVITPNTLGISNWLLLLRVGHYEWCLYRESTVCTYFIYSLLFKKEIISFYPWNTDNGLYIAQRAQTLSYTTHASHKMKYENKEKHYPTVHISLP